MEDLSFSALAPRFGTRPVMGTWSEIGTSQMNGGALSWSNIWSGLKSFGSSLASTANKAWNSGTVTSVRNKLKDADVQGKIGEVIASGVHGALDVANQAVSHAVDRRCNSSSCGSSSSSASSSNRWASWNPPMRWRQTSCLLPPRTSCLLLLLRRLPRPLPRANPAGRPAKRPPPPRRSSSAPTSPLPMKSCIPTRPGSPPPWSCVPRPNCPPWPTIRCAPRRRSPPPPPPLPPPPPPRPPRLLCVGVRPRLRPRLRRVPKAPQVGVRARGWQNKLNTIVGLGVRTCKRRRCY
ncbi:pVI [Porcine adenovirus 3]|uniref:pVI n=1 Tax=Porcine adenovirus A serotype 3 TaxID=35265 RepID=UPI00001D96D5|nr:pVI [Porcine adenovirus 3]